MNDRLVGQQFGQLLVDFQCPIVASLPGVHFAEQPQDANIVGLPIENPLIKIDLEVPLLHLSEPGGDGSPAGSFGGGKAGVSSAENMGAGVRVRSRGVRSRDLYEQVGWR